MNCDVVVARYQEDVTWLAPLAAQCCVYNKGGPADDGAASIAGLTAAGARCRRLPNVGREAHTYLHHIVERYDDGLADVTVFVQGCIADHGPLLRGLEPVAFVEVAAAEAAAHGVSQNFAVQDVPWVYLHRDFRIAQYGGLWIRPAPCAFGEWFARTLGGVEVPEVGAMRVYWSALFAVRRDRVRARPRAFYEGLLRQVEDCNSPEEAHYLERAWYYIFSGAE
jgi:hypothetical protein